MKIRFIEDFKTKDEFQEIKNKKRCWNKCHFCQSLWNDIETNNVHMLNYSDVKEWINGNGTFFICDNCKHKIKIE